MLIHQNKEKKQEKRITDQEHKEEKGSSGAIIAEEITASVIPVARAISPRSDLVAGSLAQTTGPSALLVNDLAELGNGKDEELSRAEIDLIDELFSSVADLRHTLGYSV